jgi:hypothetical protein
MAYRHGFQNAGTFAGILIENSDPFRDTNVTPAALMSAAAWKINIAHVAHKDDDTYPLATVQASFAALQANGFPATLIVKEGHHYDADDPVNKRGTDYDLSMNYCRSWRRTGRLPEVPTTNDPRDRPVCWSAR